MFSEEERVVENFRSEAAAEDMHWYTQRTLKHLLNTILEVRNNDVQQKEIVK